MLIVELSLSLRVSGEGGVDVGKTGILMCSPRNGQREGVFAYMQRVLSL